MIRLRLAAAALLSVSLVSVPLAEGETVADMRLRATAPHLEALIAAGMASSPTFRALVARVQRSDLVVYILESDALSARLHGQTTFMAATETTRYLQVEIGWGLKEGRAIAVIGHELQHAVEVADAPEVRSTATFARFYQRIGHHSGVSRFGESNYDTLEAMVAGERVWRELSRAAD